MGGLEGPPKPPERSGHPGAAVAALVNPLSLGGAAKGPQAPRTLGPPRRSRGGPRQPALSRPRSGRGRGGAAVGDQGGARDERRVVRGQEEGAVRDVLRLAHAPERDAAPFL